MANELQPKYSPMMTQAICYAYGEEYPYVVQNAKVHNTGYNLYSPKFAGGEFGSSLYTLTTVRSDTNRYNPIILDAGTYDVLFSAWYTVPTLEIPASLAGTTIAFMDGTDLGTLAFTVSTTTEKIHLTGTYTGLVWGGAEALLRTKHSVRVFGGTALDGTAHLRGWSMFVLQSGA